MSVNEAVATTLADVLSELGDIAASRVRLSPAPGTATAEDCLAVNETEPKALCELVDGTLVEKAMGYESSVVAATILFLLKKFVVPQNLGLISGADGFFRLVSSTRGPDVAFVNRQRLPNGRFPEHAHPQLAPNLVVEVLSPGNTRAEMARKRREYFDAGVELIWMVDCRNRSVAIYTSATNYVVVGELEAIDGGTVLPGFRCGVGEFFTDLDIGVDRENE